MTTSSALEVRDARLHDVVGTFDLVEVASGFQFTEGAVWSGRGQYLVFSDIAASRMYRFDGREISAYRTPSNMANGSVYDGEGRLITCEHANSRVVREEADGSLTTLADFYDGLELNSPNDVIVCDDVVRAVHGPDLWTSGVLRRRSPSAAAGPRRVLDRAGTGALPHANRRGLRAAERPLPECGREASVRQ